MNALDVGLLALLGVGAVFVTLFVLATLWDAWCSW